MSDICERLEKRLLTQINRKLKGYGKRIRKVRGKNAAVRRFHLVDLGPQVSCPRDMWDLMQLAEHLGVAEGYTSDEFTSSFVVEDGDDVYEFTNDGRMLEWPQKKIVGDVLPPKPKLELVHSSEVH